jgi:subtilisin family serine protease
MCDKIAGELLLSFHKEDQAAYELIGRIEMQQVPHVEVIESLSGKLSALGLEPRADLEFEFFRLRVPVGEEEWKINYLQFFYKLEVFSAYQHGQMNWDVFGKSNLHLQIVPNSILAIAASASAFGAISLTPMHQSYAHQIGLGFPTYSHTGLRILILDTGIDAMIAHNSLDSRNFVDPHDKYNVADDNGHGTAVAAIISDLCPSADLIIYKVADMNGRASEWDTLAGLAAATNAKVVNLSLAFGLNDKTCMVCGRESQSSRSAVFENLVMQVNGPMGGAIVVAAAGNKKKDELAFPARFNSVMAIESVDSSGNLSEFTNRSTIDHESNDHPNVFVLPGGQKDQSGNTTEYAVETSTGKRYFGTSFAAAYASAVIANTWLEPAHTSKDAQQLAAYLQTNADHSIPNYLSQTHGNGLMRFI